MLSILFGVVARCSILVGLALILGKSLPRISNKAYRFVFLFVLFGLLNFIYNYVNVRLLGYHKMSWTAAAIIALLLAIPLTFWPPEGDPIN